MVVVLGNIMEPYNMATPAIFPRATAHRFDLGLYLVLDATHRKIRAIHHLHSKCLASGALHYPEDFRECPPSKQWFLWVQLIVLDPCARKRVL
jgi:hypothetical protein